jgi:hypothetical protein
VDVNITVNLSVTVNVESENYRQAPSRSSFPIALNKADENRLKVSMLYAIFAVGVGPALSFSKSFNHMVKPNTNHFIKLILSHRSTYSAI